jgi:hypothetical protein
MKPEVDSQNEPELALNALLDEINKQRKQNSELQSELRTMRTREIRLNKNSEILKSDNNRLKQDLALLEQKLREIEIQLTLPEGERTFSPSRSIEPFPRKSLYKSINWAYILVPLVVIGAIAAFKWQSTRPEIPEETVVVATTTVAKPAPLTAPTTAAPNTINPVAPLNTPAPSNGQVPIGQAITPAANAVAEEGYLIVQNPLGGDGMVRVMDGFTPKARVLAWINPGEKYRIRAQSPTKMRRTYLRDGKSIAFEDFFYKISDKEQWIFGYFTTKRLAN